MVDSNSKDEIENGPEETRTVFGASEDGFKAIEYLVKDKGWFEEERAAFRAALAYGASRKISPKMEYRNT